MQLPEKREFGWKLKPLASAGTSMNKMASGQIEVIIEHDVVKGITVNMLQWWFSYFSEMTVELGGKTYPAYLLWHPYDHISATPTKQEPDGPLRKGDYIHIHEAFQRNPKYVLNEKARFSKLDTEGVGITAFKFGNAFMDLLHHFKDVADGVSYRSRMVLGLEQGIMKPIVNGLVLPKKFGTDKATAWQLHNVEEVGCFENFLPDLYERRDQGKKHISLDA